MKYFGNHNPMHRQLRRTLIFTFVFAISLAVTTIIAQRPASSVVNAMILIHGGTFQMGDTFGVGEADEKPGHQVTLSEFYLAKTELTRG